MSYTAPANDSVDCDLSSSYSPPPQNEVNFTIETSTGITINVLLNGSEVDADVYVIDSSEQIDTIVSGIGTNGPYELTPNGRSGEEYHIAVEYETADTQYTAVSEPFVTVGDSLTFELSEYTNPGKTGIEITID